MMSHVPHTNTLLLLPYTSSIGGLEILELGPYLVKPLCRGHFGRALLIEAIMSQIP
jgi:hypothetical protein